MLQIQNTLVSLDLIERFFHCDLDKCLGECCVEGDAGAPLLPEEEQALKDNIERILPLLSPRAQELVREQGPAYPASSPPTLPEGNACAPLRKPTGRAPFPS